MAATYYIRLCTKSNLHFVASIDKTFARLGTRTCYFCKSTFQETVKEVGANSIGFADAEARERLDRGDLYFGRVDVVFSDPE